MGLIETSGFPSAFDILDAAAPDASGAGGPGQPHVDSLIFGSGGNGFPSAFDIIPAAAADLGGAGGPSQPIIDHLMFGQGSDAFPSAFDVIPAAAADLGGAGGPSQPHVDSLIFGSGANAFPSGFDIAGTIVTATFTWSVPDPLLKPRTVRFDSAGSSGGGSAFQVAWVFGDGRHGGDSAAITHEYADFGEYVATLFVIQTGGIGIVAASQETVNLIDVRPPPVESDEEVLNLTMGRHHYEPTRTSSTTPEPVRASGVAEAEPGVEVVVVQLTAENVLILEACLVGATVDARLRLLVDGVSMGPAVRLQGADQGSRDLLHGARLQIPHGAVLEVRALNRGEAPGSFEATLVGRKA